MHYLPKWLFHAGIVLNTIMFIGFYIAGIGDMAVLNFLSACLLWMGLIARDRLENNE